MPLTNDLTAVWTDTSEFQGSVYTDAYGHRIASFRCMDGTSYTDKKFAANLAWCKSAYARGWIDLYIVYFVYRPVGALPQYNAWIKTLGAYSPGMCLMIDVENWGGAITGNQSVVLNALFGMLANFTGAFSRTIGYGNGSDLNNLWPQRDARCWVILAYYSEGWHYSLVHNCFSQQYTNGQVTPPAGWPKSSAPFGACDHNGAPDYNSKSLAAKILGVTSPPVEDDEMKFRLIKDVAGDGSIYAYSNSGMWWHVPDPNWEAVLLNNPDCLSVPANITVDTATFDAIKAMADSCIYGPVMQIETILGDVAALVAGTAPPATGGGGEGAPIDMVALAALMAKAVTDGLATLEMSGTVDLKAKESV